MPMTMTSPAPATLTGAAMTPADRAALLAWGREGYGGKGARMVIETDHDGFPELGAAYLPVRHPVFGSDWRLARHAYREAVTGDAVVVGREGREIARAATMAMALKMPGVAILRQERR